MKRFFGPMGYVDVPDVIIAERTMELKDGEWVVVPGSLKSYEADKDGNIIKEITDDTRPEVCYTLQIESPSEEG